MVLKHQSETVAKMKEMFLKNGMKRWDHDKVSSTHEHRLNTMERIAKDTKESVGTTL